MSFCKECQSLNVKSCSMNSVVVYKDRAEVKRVAPITISQGESEVIITGLSEAIDGDSIRVEGQGSATILDVIYNTREEKIEVDNKENENVHKGLMDQIKEKDKELKHLEFRQKAIKKQKELLAKYARHVTEVEKQTNINKDSPGDSFSSLVDGTSVSTVLEFMKQYESRLATLDERLQELDKSKEKLTDEKKVLKAKADDVDPKKNKSTSETIRSIKVILEAAEESDIVLVLSYVVSNASWTPAYDIRVFSQDKTMKVHYYGMIKQSTGEDWDNANIALSTAQPDIGGSPPQLGIHHIGFVRPRAYAVPMVKTRSSRRDYFLDEYDPTIEDSYGDDEDPFGGITDVVFLKTATRVKKKGSLFGAGGFGARKGRSRSPSPPSMEIEVAKVESGQLYNTTYKIPRTSTIPADNTEHRVTVAIIDLSPEFSYISVPKKSPLSYLQAKVKNNSAFALLKGPANIFLDNNFLAKSELSDTSPGEEFTSSLGVDQSIRITTQPLNVVRGATGRLTKSNQITYTQVYTVKNTQANTVKLKVLDQVPLSSDERLKVVMITPDIKKQKVSVQFSHGIAIINEDNNIEWACTIPLDVEINLKLMYSVEFPPNDVVEGLQS